jgi:DnaJ family protein A protein 2
MPHYKRPFDFGDLYVTFEVVFPPSNWTSAANLKALETALPPRRKPELPASSSEIEEVSLSEIDPRRQQQGSNRRGAGGGSRNAYDEEDYDDDDHHHGGGGPQVQCAQQ